MLLLMPLKKQNKTKKFLSLTGKVLFDLQCTLAIKNVLKSVPEKDIQNSVTKLW